MHQLGDLASDARPLAPRARNCTKCNPRRAHSLVQMGVHYRTNGGCVSHPRRAHNLVQIIVCYNYHSAELRVRGLPKMALWYICTFGLWYICTLAHLYLLFFPYCRTDGGCYNRCTFQSFLHPIIVQMGDALSYRWGTHCRTNGGRCYSAKPREINLGGRA